jgi:hypothetical protein
MPHPRHRVEFGDFQTPPELAVELCAVLRSLGVGARGLLEPTCGQGNFLRAGIAAFAPERALGFEINPRYAEAARQAPAEVICADFFDRDWAAEVRALPEPLLVLGNPPWVTNAAVGALGGTNLPAKSNFQGHRGLDALTGKSNFDISEYMLLRLSEALAGRDAVLAILCKTGVARKVMAHGWRRGLGMGECHLIPVDARRWFGASVSACLFVARFHGEPCCTLHPDGRRIGFPDGLLVADLDRYERWRHLRGSGASAWRSGIKHDCAAVMELTARDGGMYNGLGEVVEIEDRFVYPLRKSSGLAGPAGPRRLLVPEPAGEIEAAAPRTWSYLLRHAARLDGRASSVYRSRPRFAVFGVGPYSYAPWKVAIAAMYKRLAFHVVGPLRGRPVMLDDTTYFLPCRDRDEAEKVRAALDSEAAREFYSSLIFWDAQRPVTIEVLRQLDLDRLTAAGS